MAGEALAAGEVVGDDDAGGAVGVGVGEKFARVDETLVERADGDDALFDDVGGAGECDGEKILLLAIGVVLQLTPDIFGAGDFDMLLDEIDGSAPPRQGSASLWRGRDHERSLTFRG